MLAALCRRRDAALVIAGGILDRGGLAELDRVMERALRAKVAARLRLPGFAPSIDPWLAAADALLNVSRHEGLSMAVQEALAAGLPVVATDVGGQAEIAHPALELVGHDASARDLAERLARHPLRAALQGFAQPRAPRVWSMATAARTGGARTLDTLFVTANLNAGGAQRSLVNLARTLAPRHRLAVAVCGESSHGAFASQLADAAIEVFRPAPDAEPFAVAESLLAHAQSRGAANLCFWNADPRVKLLAAKFAAPSMRVIDVSPGAYAFAEMEALAAFAASVTSSVAEYYARLDTLVLKHRARTYPECARVVVIPNGVELRAGPSARPENPRFLVSGRIAPSKRLETVLDAFARVQRAHPAAVLEIVGVAQDRDRDYAAALVRAARGRAVRFRGARFDHTHLAEPYTATVVLGTHQGSPNAVLEAMAAGIAVIANDSGGTAELVIDAETGWLLAQDAGAVELADAMLDAIARPGHAEALAASARERVRAHFTLTSMASHYLAILEGESAAGREKMTPCNPASVPPAPRPSRVAPSPATAVP